MFFVEMNKLYIEQYQAFKAGMNYFLINDTLGENTFDKIMLETSLLEAEQRANTAYNDLISAQNNLVQASFLDTETLPADTAFEIYEIIPATDSQNRTPARAV